MIAPTPSVTRFNGPNERFRLASPSFFASFSSFDSGLIAVLIFYILTIVGLFVLRRTQPEAPRPYKAFGYPVVPAIFVIGVTWFVINALVSDPISTIATLVLVAIGTPIYFFSFARAEFR